MVIDESNVQINSLREQLSSAQQRSDASEATGTTLQATVASLQQELQTAQVAQCPFVFACLVWTPVVMKVSDIPDRE